MIVNFFLQILTCFDSHQQVKCCSWVWYLSRLFSIHVLTLTKLLKMMTMMGKVLKRRRNKATIQLREETKARARAIMAPWHYGTNAPWHNDTIAQWHQCTMALQCCRYQGTAMTTLLGSRTEQQHSRSLKTENPPNTSRIWTQKLVNGDFRVQKYR